MVEHRELENLPEIYLELSKQFMDNAIALHNAIVERIELQDENARLKSRLRAIVENQDLGREYNIK
jgi:hypothetical protein